MLKIVYIMPCAIESVGCENSEEIEYNRIEWNGADMDRYRELRYHRHRQEMKCQAKNAVKNIIY